MNENLKQLVNKSRLNIDNEKSFENFVRELIEQSVEVMCKNDYHGEWLGSKIREYFGITESCSSAEGQQGYLIRTIDGELLFRVYNDSGEFVDYGIAHQDLSVTITDTDAYFYRRGEDYLIDYSPIVLGKKNENTDTN